MIDFIVAAHNAALTIEGCVRSISLIDVPKTITVVENGSTDETTRILSRLELEPNLRVKHYQAPFKSKARAANLAYGLTTAPLVCSVDADVIFIEDRFKQLLTLLPEYPFLLLTENAEDTDPLPVALGGTFMVPRNSFLTTRQVLGHRLFSPLYPKCGGEDLDLMIRVLKRGVTAGRVYGGYEHLRQTLRMGYRRRFHFHIWNLITYIKHADTAYCRQRLVYLAIHSFARLAASIEEESVKDPRNVSATQSTAKESHNEQSRSS